MVERAGIASRQTLVDQLARRFPGIVICGFLLLACSAGNAAVANLACGSAKVSFPLLSAPKAKSVMVAMLDCGQQVTVLEGESRHSGWLKVRTKKGVMGYLDAALAAGASGAPPALAPLSLPPFPTPAPFTNCEPGPGQVRAGPSVVPQLIYRVEPRYSEAARVARRSGTVRLCVTVSEDGEVREARVLRPLGYGLDEKAVEAVRQWRFRPAQKDGNPVVVVMTAEIGFHLLVKPGERPDDPSLAESYYRGGFNAAAARDYPSALTSFREAAERGSSDAQFALGKMHAEGLGVPQDYVLAHVWLNAAAANGSSIAEAARDELSRRMTAQQIAAAQALARKGPPQ